jgi:hypothetical protein
MKTLTSAIYLTSWSLVLAIVLLVQSACAQTSGQYSFQQKNAGTGFTPRNVSPQNNKAFGINGSGNLDMLSVGGSSTFAGLSDVAFSSLATGQLPRYNSVSGMWENWTPGTMASQNANSVSITGGSISGATITGSSITGLTVDAVLFDQGNGTTSTLSGGGAVDLTFTLPTTGTSLLSESSSLPAANLTGTISDSRLSATITKLGSSIDLASEVTGSLPHANIAQSGATSGQALAWNGTAWAPATVAATPGGSSGQVQYNNGGSFAGVSGLTTSSGNLTQIELRGSGGANDVQLQALTGQGNGYPVLRLLDGNGAAGTGWVVAWGSSSGMACQQWRGLELGGAMGVVWGGGGPLQQTLDTGIDRAAAGVIRLTNASTGGAALNLIEITAPASAPAANCANIWLEDNGGGKSRLMIRFATGTAQQIAIEP